MISVDGGVSDLELDVAAVGYVDIGWDRKRVVESFWIVVLLVKINDCLCVDAGVYFKGCTEA